MKVIFSASPTISWEGLEGVIERAVKESGFDVTEVIHGGRRGGFDSLVELWARKKGLIVTAFPVPDRTPGIIRSQELVHHGEALIAFLEKGFGRGSQIVGVAASRGLPVYVKHVQCGVSYRSEDDRIWDFTP